MGTSPCSAGESTPTLPKDGKPQELSPAQPHAHYIAQCHIQAALTYLPPLATSHRVHGPLAQVFDASRWGYQPKGSVLQVLWPLLVQACRDTRATWQSWAWSHPTTDSHKSSKGGREMSEGLWRWSRWMIGLCWAQIRHIFRDLQMAICDPALST